MGKTIVKFYRLRLVNYKTDSKCTISVKEETGQKHGLTIEAARAFVQEKYPGWTLSSGGFIEESDGVFRIGWDWIDGPQEKQDV